MVLILSNEQYENRGAGSSWPARTHRPPGHRRATTNHPAHQSTPYLTQDNHKEKLNDAQKLVETTRNDSTSPRRSQPTAPAEGERPTATKKKGEEFDKNKGVSDTDRMLFDKKFKNFLNHKDEFLSKARRKVKAARKGAKRTYEDVGDAEYYNEEEVLSNTDSDYQYQDAEDMQAAYDQMLTGKKGKSGKLQLCHCEMYENLFREEEFRSLL